MCTLLYQPLTGSTYHAALGMNRDEVYARPSAPPRWWPPEGGGAGFVAPVDLQAGGTWFGLAETGLFAAITNGRARDWPGEFEASGAARVPGPFRHERSRGELVAAALRLGALDAAVADLAARDAGAYAPCHLFLIQGAQAAYAAPDSAAAGFAVRWLAPGPHALTNGGLDRGDTPAVALPAGTDDTGVVAALRAALSTHEGQTARCRHGAGRGTRSSAVVLLGADLNGSRLYSAEGRPCVTPYHQVALARLSRPPGARLSRLTP